MDAIAILVAPRRRVQAERHRCSRYEDLVADRPRQAARVADFLELDDRHADAPLRSARAGRVTSARRAYSQAEFEPVNTQSVGTLAVLFGRIFKPVPPILEPMLQRWDCSA